MFNDEETQRITKTIVSVIHEVAEYSASTVGTKTTLRFSDFTSGYGDLTITFESAQDGACE